LPGLPSSSPTTSSEADDEGVKSPLSLACDFLRLRFSRSASFSRPSRVSLAAFPADPPACPSSFIVTCRLSRYHASRLLAEIRPSRAQNRKKPASGADLTFVISLAAIQNSTGIGPLGAQITAISASTGPFPCLRAPCPCGKDRPPCGPFWSILGSRACCRSSVVEHSIGNGEVDSSILSGSTILVNKIKHFSR
jgi:hypothetical protein